MFTVRKKMKFEMAHRLTSAYSECCVGTIHGHSYILELFFQRKTLNNDGMVIDFGEVKNVVQPIIDRWDHSFVLHNEDPIITSDFKKSQQKLIQWGVNPTAENMAKFFFERVKESFPELCKVRVHETDTGYAEYKED